MELMSLLCFALNLYALCWSRDRANFCGVRGRAASAPPAPKAIPQRRGGQGPPL